MSTVFNPIVSAIVLRSLALENPLCRIETSAPVSIMIAAEVPLIFPGIVASSETSYFHFPGALFLPASTSPVLSVFSFHVHFGEEISVVVMFLLGAGDRARQSRLISPWRPHL